jgi:hypothetical protein
VYDGSVKSEVVVVTGESTEVEPEGETSDALVEDDGTMSELDGASETAVEEEIP